MIFRRKLLPLALIAAASSTTFAQDNAIEEILVTAQKREQALSDVPLAIEALTEESLSADNITQFGDLFESTPKITAAHNFGPFNSILNARGISTVTDLDAVVSSYVDDIPFAPVGQSWAPSSNLFDLQRVEVLTGPQGTLYGQGAMGGTVRVITNDPDASEFSGAVQLGYGSITDGEEDIQYQGFINIPVIEDQLAVRLVYSKTEEGGYLDYTGINLEDANDAEFEDIRAKILWTPTENLSIKLMGWNSDASSRAGDRNNVNPANGKFTPGLERTDPTVGQLGDNSSEIKAYSAKIEYDFGNYTLTNAFSSMEWQQSQRGFAAGGIRGTYLPDHDNISNELRLVSNLDGPFNFIVGHYYYDGDNTVPLLVEIVPPAIPTGVFPNDIFFFGGNYRNIQSEVHSFFGEASLELLDGKMELIAGVRHFEDERTFLQGIQPTFGPNSLNRDDFTFPDPASTVDFSSTNPRFNVSYRITDDTMVYFNYATGYRSGNSNPGLSIDLAPAEYGRDLTNVTPDEVESLELGLKFSGIGGILSGDIALFQSTWKDSQQSLIFDPIGNPLISTLVNAGDLEIDGFDYNVTAQLTDALSINLRGSRLDTEWTSLIERAVIEANTNIRLGGPGVAAPRNQGTLSINFEKPVVIAGQDLELNTSMSYSAQSDVSDASGSGTIVDGFRNVNFRLAVSDPDNWEAAVYITNLTDEVDPTSVFATTIGTPPRPRTVGVTLRKDF